MSRRVEELRSLLSPCRLCPRECGADRLSGQTGICGIGLLPKVAAISIHHGEEPPLSGTGGAGNIFFSGCNLRCRFCQNFPISQLGVGREMGIGELAEAMRSLERRGAHNVNLVTASHVAAQAAEAVALARAEGLSVPVVWNSNGYESLRTLALLEGTVDVWLPDMKYADDGAARRCSGVNDYVSRNRAAVDEMYRQAGHLHLDGRSLASRGLLVRHLVLPGNLSGTKDVLNYLAAQFGDGIHISLMFQYFPAHRASGDRLLERRLTVEECDTARTWLRESGLERGWVQEPPEEVSPVAGARAPAGHRGNRGCA